jgi:8-oxo-dGTP pyrophosphatase MutT (NUDIX family)
MTNFGIHELPVTEISYKIRVLKSHQEFELQDGFIPASVLVLFLLKNNNWHLLFTKRTESVQSHKSQVSFPGGAKEASDISEIATSLREAYEEIGLTPELVTILGTMDKYATISKYLITPVIGTIPWPIILKRQKGEVQKIFTMPVMWLMKPANRYEEWREFPDGRREKVTFFLPYRGEILWGITARITLQLLSALK